MAHPWITWLSVVACIGIYLGLAVRNDYDSWPALAKFGLLPADEIWSGRYWALITSAFVHFELWHVAFNVYWLWVLGTRMEHAVGSAPFLAFYVAGAFVSSSVQLASSDTTGIGASGVLYAIFGFMWLTRQRYPRFAEAVDSRTIGIFLVWLVGCVIVSSVGLLPIANAAHISGLVFGTAVAGALVVRSDPRLRLAARVGLVGLVICAAIPLRWCPWSVTWLGVKAYDAQSAGHYGLAVDLYTRIIRLDPGIAWAYWNRGAAFAALGDGTKSEADLRKAREIDPSVQHAE